MSAFQAERCGFEPHHSLLFIKINYCAIILIHYGGELDSTGCRDRFMQGCMSKHYKGLKQITANDNVALTLAA